MRFVSEKVDKKISGQNEIEKILARAVANKDGLLLEHEIYGLVSHLGMEVPAWHFHSIADDDAKLSSKLNSSIKYVAKVVCEGKTHKTDIGGIVFDVDAASAARVAGEFKKTWGRGQSPNNGDSPLSNPSPLTGEGRGEGENVFKGVLFVEKVEYSPQLGHELLISLYQDDFFGPCIALGFGGTATEYYKGVMRPNAAQLFIPTDVDIESINAILKDLPVIQIMEGNVRGIKGSLPFEKLKEIIRAFQNLGRFYLCTNPSAPYIIDELEINPAVISDGKIFALDAVLKVSKNVSTQIHDKPLNKIGKLLEPKSVAIAGASGKNPANPANVILKKLIKGGMARENIYLIHPKEDEIEGIKCVKDLGSMLNARKNEPVDCFVVGVPAKIAGTMIAEAMEIYAAHSIEIIAAGFGETQNGRAMQKELEKKLGALSANPEKRPVINGPNTLGNTYHGVDTLFTARYKSSGTRQGHKNAALICQSGAFMITRVSDLADQVAPPICISVGNQMDLSVTDFFEYLLEDEGTDTYGLYIEGLTPNDGIRLMKLIHAARAKGKIAIVYKSGRTKAGQEAAAGHTAAMAGDYGMFENLLTLSGAIVADTTAEFNNLMMMVSTLGSPTKTLGDDRPNKKLGIAALSNAGFERCAIADHLLKGDPKNFDLAVFSDATKKKIEEIYAERGISNIVDIHDVLDLSPIMNDEGYEKIVRVLLGDENVDFGIFSMVPETTALNNCEAGERHKEDLTQTGSIMNRLIAVHRDIKKPFVVSCESGRLYERFARELINAGVPCFRSADSAARAVRKCLEALAS